MTALEGLGAHAAAGYRRGFSAPVREVLRLHLTDTVGAWIAACKTAEGQALIDFDPADRSSLAGRVALACALARLSEVDDIHLSSGTTPGALVVPAALTIGAALGRSGPEVAAAISVGYDLMTRIGEALDGPVILHRGIWPTYLLAPLAVAAVAARLLDLDEKRSAHALAIALALSAPSVGRQSAASTSRWLAIGNAARSGFAAAQAAQSGFTGDLNLLEEEFFLGVYHVAPRAEVLAKPLEQEPAVTLTSFKPWCAARQTMAAVQALREMIAEGVAPAEITRVSVGVPIPYLRMIDHGVVPGERASYLTSVSYQMALYAFDPDASLDPRQVRNTLPREMEQFMTKVAVHADEDLLRHYPQCWPAILAVESPKGAREKLVLFVPGDPERAFDELQVAAKFWRLTGPLLGEHRTENLLRDSYSALDKANGPGILIDAIERCIASLNISE